MFFYLNTVLFLGFLQFNGYFLDVQNNSRCRDWAPLRESTSNTSCDCIFFVCDRHMSSMLSHCPVSLHLLSLHHQNSSQSQHLLTCRQKTVELWRQKNGDSRYAKDGTRLLHKGCSISLNLDILWPLQIMPEQLTYVHVCFVDLWRPWPFISLTA